MEIDKAKEPKARKGAGQKIEITNEHSIEDVLKYNKDGYSIHFKGNSEEFINLSDEDFGKLPKALMVYYLVAMKESQGKLKDVVKTISEAGTARREFGYDLRVADPIEQLEIRNVPKNMEAKWVRAYDNDVRKHERKGYRVAKGDQLETFGNDGSKPGSHYVGSDDKPEMVAMLISKENFKKNSKRIKRKGEKVKEAAKQQFKDSIEKSGLKGAMAEVESN